MSDTDKPLFRRAAAMIIAVFLLVVLLAPAAAAFPGSNGKILFQGAPQSPLNYDIFVMDNNGFNEVNLTNSSAVNDFDAAWSPDGTKIAFTTNRDGNNEIYIMNADGTSPVNISNNAASDTTPAWSPNGLKLLFISNRDGNNEVFVMNADGTGVTQITSTTGTVTHKNPAWKPDASRIAYTSNKDTVPADGRFDEIYLANPDGTNEVRLTVTPNGVTNPYYSRLPGWSPDGSKIVFFSRRTNTNKDVIYTLLDNGIVEPSQTPVALSDFPSRASSHARYSPDGTRIVFNSCRIAGGGSDWNSCGDGNHEIFVMNADGSNPTRMTHALSRLDVSPDWQVVAPTVIGATCTTDCYVAPNGSDANDGASAATPLKSIQLALNTVWNNGTVHFAAGDYFENSPYGWVELTLANKSVTLLGAGSGQSIIQLPAHKTNGLLIDGSNLDIVIEGLTFTHRAAGTNAAGFNIRIGEVNAANADVTFTDVESAWATARNASMEAPGTYGTVLLDRVNMHHSVQWGMAIDSTVSNLTVTDSHFDDNGRDYSPLGTGLYLAAGLKQNVLIEDSTFNRNKRFGNSQPYSGVGLWLDSVNGVVMQNIEANGNNSGVSIGASLVNSSDVLLEYSTITGNEHGVIIVADMDRTLDGVMVRFNDLTNNSQNNVVISRVGNGVFNDIHVNRNDLSGTPKPAGMSFFGGVAGDNADGQCNWWGDASGPSAFGPGTGSYVTDFIDFTPWLLSTNLHDPACLIGNTITVTKVAAGGGTTEFEFNPSWSATNFVLKDGESTTVDQLVPGVYSVAEVTPLPTYWVLDSATCDNATTTTVVETVDPSAIPVEDGDAWVCTFTNVYAPPTNVCTVATSPLYTDIIGKGMGNPKKHKAQMKLTIPNYAAVDSLYGQMVAKNNGHANYVRFILPGKNNWMQVNAITSPAAHAGGTFWYGTAIDPLKLPTKTVMGRWYLQSTGTKNHIPRALVLYPTYESATDTFVNIFNTYDAAEGEVYWDTANGWTPTQVITESIAPPNGPTTFNVELALVDNDKDARPVWVTVEAGGVSQTQKPNNPSDGDQLNLMTFTLAGVPPGTDTITITVYSPSVALDGIEGDSAALVGMRANYMCAPLN